MQVLKSFRRDGILYVPGDDLPPGLDTVTINHYRHYGMVGVPAEIKPAGPRRRSAAKPLETKPAEPPQQLAADAVAGAPVDNTAVHTSAQSADESSTVDDISSADPARPEE